MDTNSKNSNVELYISWTAVKNLEKTLPQQTPYLEQYMLRSLMLVPPIHGGQVSEGIVVNGTDQWIRVEMAFGVKTGGKIKCICLYVVKSYGGMEVGNGSATGGVIPLLSLNSLMACTGKI
jgi:hypothetical protein